MQATEKYGLIQASKQTKTERLFMLDLDLGEDILRVALKRGGDYADLFWQRRRDTQIRLEDSKIDDISIGIEEGVGIRVIKGELAAYAHSDQLTPDSLHEAADRVAAATQGASGERGIKMVSPSTQPPTNPIPEPEQILQETSLQERIEVLKRADEAARSQGKFVSQVTATHVDRHEETLIMNSRGDHEKSKCSRVRLVVQVIANREEIIQTGQEAPGALGGFEFYLQHKPEDVAAVASKRALTMLEAEPAPSGQMAVVLRSGTGGVLFHEACGHGLELDHVLKGASVYRGKVGTRVASSLVSAADNPTLPGLWGSFDIDDEGTFSQDTLLIEEGVLQGFITGLHHGMMEGIASTGNGRRQSFRHYPVPRMTNTYILAGKSDPEEIVSSTERGLLAEKLGGGQVDPATGDFIFAVSEGYLIEGGQVTRPVRGSTLIGNGPKALELIDAVGNDPAFEAGTCGKEGQGVPVCTGCPTVRIKALTVGGTKL